VCKVGDTVEIVGLRDNHLHRCDRRRDVPQDASIAARRRTTSACSCAASKRTTSRAARSWPPRSRSPAPQGKAEIYVLTKDEVAATRRSSRATARSFYFRTTDVTGVITLPQGVEMVMRATTSTSTSS